MNLDQELNSKLGNITQLLDVRVYAKFPPREVTFVISGVFQRSLL